MAKRRAESRAGMIVTTIALPPDLHKRLAIAAIEDGAASVELIREAVQEWLDRRRRTKGGR
jgi:predicted transcriptional regulator